MVDTALYPTNTHLPFFSVTELQFCLELHFAQVKNYLSPLPLRYDWHGKPPSLMSSKKKLLGGTFRKCTVYPLVGLFCLGFGFEAGVLQPPCEHEFKEHT